MVMFPIQLLEVDHMVIASKRTECLRQLFQRKMKFVQCPLVSDELVRGKCRLKIPSAFEDDAESDDAGVESVVDVAFIVTNIDAIVRNVKDYDSDLILRNVHCIDSHPRLGPHLCAVIKVIQFSL